MEYRTEMNTPETTKKRSGALCAARPRWTHPKEVREVEPTPLARLQVGPPQLSFDAGFGDTVVQSSTAKNGPSRKTQKKKLEKETQSRARPP